MSKKAEGFSLRFVLINTGNISRKVLSKVLRSFDKNFERLQAQSSLVVLGDISISGTLMKVDNLASTLQVCADCGAKKVLIPAVSMVDYGTIPADLMTAFQIIPYSSAEDAVFKALGVE